MAAAAVEREATARTRLAGAVVEGLAAAPEGRPPTG